MKKLLYCIGFISVVSCSTKEIPKTEISTVPEQSFDQEFKQFKDYFFNKVWEHNPSYASGLGLHEYDSILRAPSKENQLAQENDFRELLDSLELYESKKINSKSITDLKLMQNYLESSIWYDSSFKGLEWNPSYYNISGGIGRILNGKYASLEIRLKSIVNRLEMTPIYFDVAKKNLKQVTKKHTELAILQNKGGLSLLRGKLVDSAQVTSIKQSLKDELTSAISNAETAINGYLSFLDSIQVNNEEEDWRSERIGKDLFFEKFTLDINSDFTAEEIYQKALQRKEELHAQMIQNADTLWGKYFGDAPFPKEPLIKVKQLIDKIAESHVEKSEFINEIKRQIPTLAQFVSDHDLLTQDSEKPLVVRETPKYMRGSGAGASISAPGPFDKFGNTYYNVTPLDDYSEEEAESYLREYNHYVLQVLNIHEAIPGHYTQLVYGNESPSLVKSIFGNGAMIEGWAVYSELMMLEEGYQNSPEMWLMYSKWHLRVVMNTILDYSVHVLNIDEAEGMDLLTNQAFQEQTEAANKWRRANLSSVQLCSYFTGFTEIYQLRNELKKIQGDQFSLKKFHEEFLSYGNSPVRFIKRLMLENQQ